MNCSIEGCTRPIMYLERQICQMHYFRYMRNGYYHKKPKSEIKRKRTDYKVQMYNGYIKVYSPECPIAMKSGMIFEHRKVFYDRYGERDFCCEICGKSWSYSVKQDHIDHIDGNRANNHISNLRPLCSSCNTSLGKLKRPRSLNTYPITCFGETKCASKWSKDKRCTVHKKTIIRRLDAGMTPEDAITLPSATYKGQTQMDMRRAGRNAQRV